MSEAKGEATKIIRRALPEKILSWALAYIAVMIAFVLSGMAVFGWQLQIGPTPVCITHQPVNIDLAALQQLMRRIRVEPGGVVHFLVDETQQNGRSVVIDFGSGDNKKHVQLAENGAFVVFKNYFPDDRRIQRVNLEDEHDNK